MRYFFDTNILLNKDKKFFQSLTEPFYISTISIQELENIKTSSNKDIDIKYKARKIARWLIENQNKYIPIISEKQNISNDMNIIISAEQISKQQEIIFITADLNCYLLAKSKGLKVQIDTCIDPAKEKYNGYIKIFCNSDDELADFYSNILYTEKIKDLVINNEYILIYDKDKNLIDKYRYIDNKILSIPFTVAKSKMFGNIKPIDPYQELVLDSFKNNQITLVKGPAGTGKSLLSLAWLFKQLEEGRIDKIIIFCNTIATAGSAKLGYYPGSRTEKLLDSQIGNFLISKLGDRIMVEDLIDKGQLVLLPMSDIRGYDTSGIKAGVYITQAQNLNIELMKLALQRIGEESICILDGDNDTQVDLNLYAGNNNGLKRVSEVFRGQDFYGQVFLQTIHRSKIAEIASKM